MYGWAGTILRVDLSSRSVVKEPLSDTLARNYVGGRGINSRILYDEIKPRVDALSPENVLVFGTGPLTGTLIASSRFTVTAKSPLTNTFGDANAGGHFAPELKFAGYDHIVFSGKADKPVYLWIDDEHVELRDASHLWGKTTYETDRLIKEEIGDPRIHIACIGQAGENLVRFACVMADLYSAAARTGMGAVMGSKNLKAIAVRGTKGIKVADPEAFRTLALDLKQKIMDDPSYQEWATYGTTILAAKLDKMGIVAVKWGRQAQFDQIDEIRHTTLKKKYLIRPRACFGCVIHCKHWFEIKEGPYAGERGQGIEYGSTLAPWGPVCGISYAPSLFKIHSLCNQYGLDALSGGEMMAVAMDWYDLGLITKRDTEGIELEWGNYEAAIEMLHKLIKREGFGDVLADGPLPAAERVGKGAERSLSHSKGQSFFIDDSRSMVAYALSKATSTRGADHLRGVGFLMPPARITPEEFVKRFGAQSLNPTSYEDKAYPAYFNQCIATMADAVEVCKYNTQWVGQYTDLNDMANLFTAATGIKMDGESMRKIADRIWAVERAFSVREGITRKDDVLSGKEWNEPVPSGPYKGVALDKKKWAKMLDEYYNIVGWDKKTGAPTRARLEELGLKDIADELHGSVTSE